MLNELNIAPRSKKCANDYSFGTGFYNRSLRPGDSNKPTNSLPEPSFLGCAVCTSSIKQDESERTKKMMMYNAHGGEEQISRMQKSSRLGFCPIQFIAFKYSNNQGLFCFSTANLVGESFQLINPLPAPRCNRRHFELADGLFRLFLRFENR